MACLRVWGIHRALAAVGIVGWFVLLSVADASGQSSGTVVIAAKTSLIRVEPAVEAKVLLSSERGTEFAVTGSTKGWIKVSISGGGAGWLPDAEVGLKVTRSGRVCVEMALKDALTVGAIDGAFEGNGSSSGDSISLRAKGALKLSVCPSEIERGTVLVSVNPAAQNMVLVQLRGIADGAFLRPAVSLRFEPDIEAEYAFEAYCLNFEKDNPSGRDRFALQGTAPEAVLRVLNVPDSTVQGRQLAIWAVTDNISSRDARDKFQATDEDIAVALQVAKSAGLAIADYRLLSGR
jgi:hypothetical protein